MATKQFSSFQIAKMLNVSRQAVNQWIDKGYIDSYRTPGGHRRVALKDLVRFLEARRIPIPTELGADPSGQCDLDGIRIVMIDDDVDFLELFRQALAEQIPAAHIQTYSHPTDGLISVGIQRPNLLLLDMKMPSMDGNDVIKRLRINPHTQDLPIIVVTAYDEGPAQRVLRNAHVEKVISKAVPLLEITQTISEFLIQTAKNRV